MCPLFCPISPCSTMEVLRGCPPVQPRVEKTDVCCVEQNVGKIAVQDVVSECLGCWLCLINEGKVNIWHIGSVVEIGLKGNHWWILHCFHLQLGVSYHRHCSDLCPPRIPVTTKMTFHFWAWESLPKSSWMPLESWGPGRPDPRYDSYIMC